MCDLAGIAKPAHLEGDSFAPLLDDPARKWKRAAFSQYPRGKVMGYSLCAKGFRYTTWVDRKETNKVIATELYDHTRDPRENENVIGEAEYKQVVEKLAAYHKGGWGATREVLRGE